MRKHPFYYIICLFLILVSFNSCSEDFDVAGTTEKVDEILLAAPDSFSELEKIVKEKKIIFIGSNDHRQINDHNFLNRESVEKLRKLGIKYILVEAGGPKDFVFSKSDLEDNWIRVFYPWHGVDVQYHENEFRKVVLDVNNKLKEEDQLIMVSLEANRENEIPEDSEETDFFNYRDKYMFDVAKRFIDNSKSDEKVLIYCGSGHGIKEPVKYFGPNKWKTLGSQLAKAYGDDYGAYSYVSLSGAFYPWVIGGINLPGQQIKEKFITSEYAQKVNKLINFVQPNLINLYDGFIIDKNTEYGLLYGYALHVPVVLKEVIKETKETAAYCNEIDKSYDYNPDQYYKLDSFIRNIYYLKLFYGDLFDYNLWNPSTKLQDALNKLPLDYKGSKSLDNDKMAEYQNYLNYSMVDLHNIQSKKDAKICYEHWLPFIEKAKSIYPEEVWCDYWMAVVNYKLGNFDVAKTYCDAFLNNPLSMSCQVLPEILNTAIQCCKNIGEDYSLYEEKLGNLSNEFEIDITKISMYL